MQLCWHCRDFAVMGAIGMRQMHRKSGRRRHRDADRRPGEKRRREFSGRVLLPCLTGMLLLNGCSRSMDSSEAAPSDADSTVTDGGTVLNIYCWDSEIRNLMENYYPGYEREDDTTGRIGEVTVHFIITPTDDNAYEDNLDSILPGNLEAAAADKVDVFLVDEENAGKYIGTEESYAVKLSDLGITQEELSEQYSFTREIVTDADGNQRGSSWQACAGGMIYNRTAAKSVLGSDDPADVQEAVKDWDTFKETAERMKRAGYCMTASVDDTYRAYTGTAAGSWVNESGEYQVPEEYEEWAKDSHELLDEGMTGSVELWSEEWNLGFYEDTAVFAYFGPLWMIHDAAHAGEEGTAAACGDLGLVSGPQSFFWGGSWICAADGTDNKTLVKEIILTLTADESVMRKIAENDGECVNHRAVLKELAEDSSLGSSVLGGQNPYEILAEAGENLEVTAPRTGDREWKAAFRGAIKNYIEGRATYAEAVAQFKENAAASE